MGLTGLALTVAAAPYAGASGGMTAQRDATAFAAAIARDPSVVKSATWATIPPNGNPAAVGNVWEVNTVPLAGETLGVLSTGDATIDYGTQSTNLSVNNGGGPYRGANDVVTLKLTLAVPANRNCLAIAVSYFTEDTPIAGFDGPTPGAYVDGFLAELDPTTPWAITSNVHTAPAADFARTVAGNMLDVWTLANPLTGQADYYAEQRAGLTAYNVASEWEYAMTPVSPGTHTVELSVFDRGDSTYDSSAVLDDLRLVNRTPAACTGMVPAQVIGFGPPATPATKVTKNDRQRKAKLTFSATAGIGETLTVECALDGAAFTPCTSPAKYKKLKRGKHVVAVRTIDGAGNISESATTKFRIKKVKK